MLFETHLLVVDRAGPARSARISKRRVVSRVDDDADEEDETRLISNLAGCFEADVDDDADTQVDDPVVEAERSIDGAGV